MPLALRLLAVFLFAGLMLLLDRRKPVAERHRWREYLFLLAGTGAGALTGLAIDAVTSTLSPEYFVMGKGIPDGPGFRSEVLLLGARAGTSAGLVASAILLFANREPARALALFRWLPYPLVGAVSIGAIAGVVQEFSAAVAIPGFLDDLDPARAARFMTVWITHLGVYGGAILGLIIAGVQVRRAKLTGSSAGTPR